MYTVLKYSSVLQRNVALLCVMSSRDTDVQVLLYQQQYNCYDFADAITCRRKNKIFFFHTSMQHDGTQQAFISQIGPSRFYSPPTVPAAFSMHFTPIVLHCSFIFCEGAGVSRCTYTTFTLYLLLRSPLFVRYCITAA